MQDPFKELDMPLEKITKKQKNEDTRIDKKHCCKGDSVSCDNPYSNFFMAFKAYQEFSSSQKRRWKDLCDQIECDPSRKELIYQVLENQ